MCFSKQKKRVHYQIEGATTELHHLLQQKLPPPPSAAKHKLSAKIDHHQIKQKGSNKFTLPKTSRPKNTSPMPSINKNGKVRWTQFQIQALHLVPKTFVILHQIVINNIDLLFYGLCSPHSHDIFSSLYVLRQLRDLLPWDAQWKTHK